jgi:ABC-type thiamin/hydroxymethylpyrimidine transport system permease subunit
MPAKDAQFDTLSRYIYKRSRILNGGGFIMSDILHALEPAAAILFGVVALTGIVASVAVKRGDAALSKHHH